MRLFLSGGGSAEDSVELDKLFAENLDKTKPLLYIPIAMDIKRHSYEECFKWIKSALNPLGVDNIIMWTDLRGKSGDTFDQFSGIYIGGGNTFWLMREIRESELFDSLKELAEKDLPMYGGSAGAIIFAKSIIPALSADRNQIKLKDFSGLNLVNDFEIWPHYGKSSDSLINDFKKDHKLGNIIAIPNNAGLFVTEEGIQVVGPAKVTVFGKKGKTVVEPGESI